MKGSGVFVSGGGDKGGKLIVRRLETGPVDSDGGIAPGVPDRISGGVFVVYGAFVDSVRNQGPVTTYGPNDMVLDNWGAVDLWIAEDKITSFGASAIGFVNFGAISRLQIKAPIETFGRGARGFNAYAGTVNTAEFDRIITHADGAGDSLVKGVVKRLLAIPLSIKPGGSAREIEVAGGLVAHGPGVAPLELHGHVETLRITEGAAASEQCFDAI